MAHEWQLNGRPLPSLFKDRFPRSIYRRFHFLGACRSKYPEMFDRVGAQVRANRGTELSYKEFSIRMLCQFYSTKGPLDGGLTEAHFFKFKMCSHWLARHGVSSLAELHMSRAQNLEDIIHHTLKSLLRTRFLDIRNAISIIMAIGNLVS